MMQKESLKQKTAAYCCASKAIFRNFRTAGTPVEYMQTCVYDNPHTRIVLVSMWIQP